MEGITCFLSNTLHKQEAEVIFYLSKIFYSNILCRSFVRRKLQPY